MFMKANEFVNQCTVCLSSGLYLNKCICPIKNEMILIVRNVRNLIEGEYYLPVS